MLDSKVEEVAVDRSADLSDSVVEAAAAFPPLPLGANAAFRDPVKEGSRKFRRTVFDFKQWREHRSTSRYARHMKSAFTSRMIRGLAPPLLFIGSTAVVVCSYNAWVEAGLAPDMLPVAQISGNGPFGLTSFALSLLLVFRTNASYARWLDARKLWGKLVNRSRDITRQALTYFPPEDEALARLFARWVAVFPRVLMCHITDEAQLASELPKLLLPHEVEAVLAAKHGPNYCLQVISETLQAAHLPAGAAAPPGGLRPSDLRAMAALERMDENLSIFEDILGSCERILRAPIPLSYTRHTSRFMMVWLTLMPFSLWPSCGWATVPLAVITSFLLLGIEEIGVSIEEPFSILPLEALCDTIEANVRELRSLHAHRSQPGSDAGKPRAPPARQIVQAAIDAGAT